MGNGLVEVRTFGDLLVKQAGLKKWPTSGGDDDHGRASSSPGKQGQQAVKHDDKAAAHREEAKSGNVTDHGKSDHEAAATAHERAAAAVSTGTYADRAAEAERASHTAFAPSNYKK